MKPNTLPVAILLGFVALFVMTAISLRHQSRRAKPDAGLPVGQMSDAQLLKEWQYANSARYETGRELDNRYIHAKFQAPPGAKVLGHVEVYLRGCWYGLDYWKNTNIDPRWRNTCVLQTSTNGLKWYPILESEAHIVRDDGNSDQLTLRFFRAVECLSCGD